MNGIGAKVVGIDSKKKLNSHELTDYYLKSVFIYNSSFFVRMYRARARTHQRFRHVPEPVKWYTMTRLVSIELNIIVLKCDDV